MAMLFMVIERYRGGDARPVYARLAERGRMMPEGIVYRGSWVESTLQRCFQVMECADERLLQAWADSWRDLVDFELVPVITSEEARKAVLGDASS